MKQTAVEFYYLGLKKILNNIIVTNEQVNEMVSVLEKAKQIEKQHIIEAYEIGSGEDPLLPNEDSEKYYNKTFKK